MGDVHGAVGVDADKGFHVAAAPNRHAPADVTIIARWTGLVATFAWRCIASTTATTVIATAVGIGII